MVPVTRWKRTGSGEFRQFCDLLRFLLRLLRCASLLIHLLRFFGGEIPCEPVVVGFFGILAHAASKCDLSSNRMAPAEGFKQPLADGANVLHAGW